MEPARWRVMADDVLRIVLEGDGGGTGGRGGTPGASAPSSSGRGSRSLDPHNFDPIAEAGRLLEQEKRRKSVQEYFNLSKYGTTTDPKEEAARKKEQERDAKQQRQEEEAERRRGLTGRVLAVQQAGQVASQAGIPFASQAASALTGAMTGSPIAIITAVASAAISAVKAIDAKVTSVAKDAGEYSPQAQFAEAQAEIRRIQGDMRRAQETGPALARMTEAQSKLDEAVRDFWSDPAWLEFKAAVIGLMVDMVRGSKEALKGAGEAFQIGVGSLGVLRTIAKNTDKEEDPMDDPFLDKFSQMKFDDADGSAGSISREARARFDALQDL